MAGTAGADMCQPPSIFVQTGRNVSVTIRTFSHLRWPQTTRDGGAVQLKVHGCLLAVQRRCRASTATAAAVGWPVDSQLWVPTARARGAAASDRAAQADGCRTAQAWGGGEVWEQRTSNTSDAGTTRLDGREGNGASAPHHAVRCGKACGGGRGRGGWVRG